MSNDTQKRFVTRSKSIMHTNIESNKWNRKTVATRWWSNYFAYSVLFALPFMAFFYLVIVRIYIHITVQLVYLNKNR
jgi:hypothetical protein